MRDVYRLPPAIPILGFYGLLSVLFVPEFMTLANLRSILFSASILVPVVIGMQVLLILGRFDLSVGGIAALCGMSAGLVAVSTDSPLLGILLGFLVGFFLGCTNGLFVARLNLDPLIVTLAMVGVSRSLALAVGKGRIVAGLPEVLLRVSQLQVLGIPVLTVAVVLLACVAAYLARHAVVFRRFYAAGSNPEAANKSGVRVDRLTILGYCLAGLGSAATGILQSTRTLSASPTIFQELPLEAIAACILGGSSLEGGRGHLAGSLVGLLVIISTRNLVVMLGIPVYWKDFAVGALLLVAVLAPRLLENPKNVVPEGDSTDV